LLIDSQLKLQPRCSTCSRILREILYGLQLNLCHIRLQNIGRIRKKLHVLHRLI